VNPTAADSQINSHVLGHVTARHHVDQQVEIHLTEGSVPTLAVAEHVATLSLLEPLPTLLTDRRHG